MNDWHNFKERAYQVFQCKPVSILAHMCVCINKKNPKKTKKTSSVCKVGAPLT